MKYRVTVKWLNHPSETTDVEAINAFQAIEQVVQGQNKGLYDTTGTTASPLPRKVTPYTLVIQANRISHYPLNKDKSVQRVEKMGGVIIEDWESALKLAYTLNEQANPAGKVLSSQVNKQTLFVPDIIPDWVSLLTPENMNEEQQV